MLIESLNEQLRRVEQFEKDVSVIERRLTQHLRDSAACQTLAEIPGVGLLTATAITASMGSPSGFKNAREFAAWVSLAPRQTGYEGRVRQLCISKRGDTCLRTLLMHGARSIVGSQRSSTWLWLAELLKRWPFSVVVVAVAYKLARTIWAVLCKGKGWPADAWQAA
ncbi:transposase [Paucibacter sp. APW11]|uniref:Transposase n=1 Tax=Roseateles aquae TaxID=3077235 RepID=A0ABU3PEJ8_9BURK|nr:transposase [Paucibacter sp. APW11]MDT9001020.1 transposase [Paucibacter sp. APW11]